MTSTPNHRPPPEKEEAPSVSIAEIRRALARLPAKADHAPAEIRHAAVAMVFAGDPEAPELCFIRRAEREGDPWSGQMAFPGGKADPEDAGLREAAERETMEEVGLRLRDSHYLAALAHSPVRSGGVETGMRLFPFVYYLGEERPPLTPNGEVAEAFWVPLSHILDLRNNVEMPLRRNGELLKFPSVRYRGRHIWGVTYRVLVQFTTAISRPLADAL